MASCKLAQKIAHTYAPVLTSNSQNVEAIQSPTGMKAGRKQQLCQGVLCYMSPGLI